MHSQTARQSSSLVMEDEYIEQCAAVYIEKKLQAYGILFSMFVLYPNDILAAVVDRDFQPMLMKHSTEECKQIFCSFHLPTIENINKQLCNNN